MREMFGLQEVLELISKDYREAEHSTCLEKCFPQRVLHVCAPFQRSFQQARQLCAEGCAYAQFACMCGSVRMCIGGWNVSVGEMFGLQ